MTIRKVIALAAIILSLIGAAISASSMSFDETNVQKYLRGIPAGPTWEQAVRENAGVLEAREKADRAKLLFALLSIAAVMQIGLVLTDKQN